MKGTLESPDSCFEVQGWEGEGSPHSRDSCPGNPGWSVVDASQEQEHSACLKIAVAQQESLLP